MESKAITQSQPYSGNAIIIKNSGKLDQYARKYPEIVAQALLASNNGN